MGRHQWVLHRDPFEEPEHSGRFRLLLGRGALICVVAAVLGWLSVSLLLTPRGGGLEPLAEVPLNGSQRVPGTPAASPSPAVPDQAEQPGPPEQPRDPGQAGPAGESTSAGAAAVPTSTLLVIHVAGAVKHPGIYQLASGARAHEAIAAAGGLSRDADDSALNLAAVVHDAEQLYVPRKGESPRAPPVGSAPDIGSGADPGTGAGAGQPGAIVNVNTADATILQQLPGIGPALAGHIIEFRTANGPFSSLAELDAVSGIGPVMLKRLEPLVEFR